MSPIFSKPTDPREGPPKPFYERVQDYVFEMDRQSGTSFFRIGLFAVMVVFVILMYTGTQFYGLRDKEAMDTAQLGRNLWSGHGYTTRFIRPIALWHLSKAGKPPLNPASLTQPELYTPPVYPLMLSAVFRVVNPNFDVTLGMQTLRADRLVMVVAWGWFLVGLVMLYLLCRELFDHRVAVMTVTMYVLCDALLDSAASGLPASFLSVLFIVVAYGVVKAEKWAAAGKSSAWVNGALAASALAVGLGTLTQYAFVAVLVPLLVYVAVSFPRDWTIKAGICAGIFALVMAPWVARNWRVSGTMFGLAPYAVHEGTLTYREGAIQRRYDGSELKFRMTDVLRKTLANGRKLYEQTLKDVGSNYLIAFFLASLLHRYRREETFRLRRLVFWSLMAAIGWLSVAGPPARNFLNVFVPLIIMYGVSFFYVVFERLQFRTRLLRMGMIGLFAFLNSLPLVFAILPPNTKRPYPPYAPGIVVGLGKEFRADELLVSDIPWAVAWYADRSTLWTTATEKDFFAINDTLHVATGIYLTQVTLLEPQILDLASGKQDYWLTMFQKLPPNFPLQVFEVFPQSIEVQQGPQILISNRPRIYVRKPEAPQP